jgi:hypothetical protein
MTHEPWKRVIVTLCLSISVIGCGKQEESKPKSATQPVAVQKPTERISYPPGDVRWHFVAKAQPLLDEGAQVRLWVGSREKDKPEFLIEELDLVRSIVYAPDGTLYFVGDHQNAIVAIKPDKTKKVIARSGNPVGHPKSDSGEQITNGFEGLVLLENGNLITLLRGEYLYHVFTTRKEPLDDDSRIYFKAPDGREIESFGLKFGQPDNHPYSWIFSISSIDTDDAGFLYLKTDESYNNRWFKIRLHYETIDLRELAGPQIRIKENIYKTKVSAKNVEEIMDIKELPASSYMYEVSPWLNDFIYAIPASDGYIYAIEQGKDKQDPDLVIRIGDPGLSSLRKEATRVTIAKFKHGELTGALAFSPKGELAVGAQNAIYLITPGPANKPQPEKAP